MAKRRRILLLVDFAYVSARPIASGIVHSLSVRSDLDFVIVGGHPSNADETCFLESGVDGAVSCLGTNHPMLRRFLSAHPHCPVVFASVVHDLATLRGTRSAAIVCDHAAIAESVASLLMRHGSTEFAYVGARQRAGGITWDDERRRAFSGTVP